MNWFNPQSPFFRGVGKFFEILWLCVLFFITAIPILTIGASITSLYCVCTKTVRRNQGYLTKEYFFCFKKNFRQATILWMLQCLIGVVLSFNITLCQITQKQWLKYLEPPMWILLILLICFSVYYFALLAHFDNTTLNLVKYAIVIPILNLPNTLFTTLIIVGIGIVFYLFPQLILVAPGILGLVLSLRLERLFIKYE